MKLQPFKTYDVYLNGKKIDTVTARGYDTEEMKTSLVNHDGYNPSIEVRERK